MNIIKTAVFLFILMMGNTAAHAQIPVTDVEPSAVTGLIELSYQARQDSAGKSLFGKVIDVDKTIGDTDYSASLTAYHDQEFWSVYAGAGRTVGNLYVRLAAGIARYDDKNWFVMNPVLYYEDEEKGFKALFHTEWTPKDKAEPWYFKGYAYFRIIERISAGIRGESFVGVGPSLERSFGKHNAFWVYVPVTLKPSEKEDQKRVVAGLTYKF